MKTKEDDLFPAEVPIEVIIDCVEEAININKELFLTRTKDPGTRRRDLVIARQISMLLSKENTRQSLSYIGYHIGRKDHATVLHAIKTVKNLIETKDKVTTGWLYKAREKVDQWKRINIPDTEKLILKRRLQLVEKYLYTAFNNYQIPYDVQERIAKSFDQEFLIISENDRNKLETISDPVQDRDKKEL